MELFSLRSKRFREVSEQRKTEERDFFGFGQAKMEREPKNERVGMGRGRKETLAKKPLDFENPARQQRANSRRISCRRFSPSEK